MPKTNHMEDIKKLRDDAGEAEEKEKWILLTASDLLELHDLQNLSLDDWRAARTMVEGFIGHPITRNLI